ncbi:MAG: hypothetical protein LPK45_04785 [Bacteroidota bacterium]|nr:hypothetical protein [Bacteroidota bacterium]MDX5430372.1 hypothetical protein [Bacteroidota bacterium]MDX5469133.1 hypothetical protein [Bacteroidota bacterium]
MSQEFLMEMMDINEALMDAKMEGDAKKLQELSSSIQSIQQALREEWETVCRAWDEQKKEAQLDLIKEFYFRNQYLKRLLEQAV